MRPLLSAAAWSACLSCLWTASAASPAPSPTTSADAPAFTYNASAFLLHGEPYTMIGGQMDPQRIPPAYWADRLAKARAMGLNTIFSYVYWNLLEPRPGQWDSTSPANDIARFFTLAQQASLHVVLRPGPYICGEREWGGFPAWLTQVPGLQTVRSHDPAFLAAATNYLTRLAADLRSTTASPPGGGALVMVQVENEYGSYGKDHVYTAALRDTLRRVFPGVALYTNDGGVDWTLAGGSVPGVLAATDGDPRGGFNARRLYISDRSMQGPLLDGEYYTLAPDVWGSRQPHNVPSAAQAATFVADIDYVLGGGNAISLYMFHGGTNFGLGNGALYRNTNVTAPFTTSYDYGAPLDESGRTTPLYAQLRRAILRRLPASERAAVPTPPPNRPHMALPAASLTAYASLFGSAPSSSSSSSSSTAPLTMEALGQAYGLVLYEHIFNGTSPVHGILRAGDSARDRVLVYVNGVRVGVVDSTYERPATVTLALHPGDTLQLLVENLGRVDYYSQEATTANMLLDPYKGIVGEVSVGATVLRVWASRSYPLEETPGNTTITTGPLYYKGAFSVDAPPDGDVARLDTFLAIPAGVKGVVWVNGFCLGRYWAVGPQQSLYLPGPVLRVGGANGTNEVVVLELEPESILSAKTAMTAVGLADRVWANHPDPDAP
ncbi:hypothetical protein SCUCBS95973_005944 [Sporothrix curviconia]|uniref:Beta-galactosidase n=1 Tax=Sporothrix curviconia TaxID=1260050 RepID=A0ABP0C1I1_9PEZI